MADRGALACETSEALLTDECQLGFHEGGFDANLQEQRDEVLAVQSIFSGDSNVVVEVTSSPDEAGKGLFTLQVSVPVKTETAKISVSVWQNAVKEEAEELGAHAGSPPPAMGKGIKFARSDSGQRWLGSFEVSHLLPLSLQLVLPPAYPSHCSPRFSLSGAWLSAGQLAGLCGQLDQLWQSSPGLPVLYTWLDWLENNSLSNLGITDSLNLTPEDGGEGEEDRDPRAILPSNPTLTTVSDMIQYNRHREEVAFYQSLQECQVCFDQKPGTEFHRLADCLHHFCQPCLSDYCTLHVSEGTVERLKCPDMECEEAVPPGVVLSLLPEELGQRWERLVLQRSLDSMGDVVWCPRCRSVVIKEEGEGLQLAVCTVCFFAFCTQCEEAWHQGSECRSAEKALAALEGGSAGNTTSERQRVAEQRRKLMEEAATATVFKRERFVNCPSCKAKVHKTGGCNFMRCRCDASFCWSCGKSISSYDHFRTSPSCQAFVSFEGEVAVHTRRPEMAIFTQLRLEMDPEVKKDVCVCPSCKQRNLRDNSNNHIRCWNCKQNFCFLCRQKILKDISAHFRPPSLCKQHS